MRFVAKYKSYKHVKNLVSKFPLRILRFNKSKWKKLISNFNTNKKLLKFKFVKILGLTNSFKKWSKISSSFKLGLNIKNNLFNLFDNSISIKFLRKNLILQKNLKLKDIYIKALIYPNYRLDIFLFNLKFFVTSFQARQAINNKIVLVNNKKVLGNFFLKKKDIISFKEGNSYDFFSFRASINTFFNSQQIFSFCEFCPYTKNIIILKDANELSEFDFYLLNSKFFDYKKLLTYISK